MLFDKLFRFFWMVALLGSSRISFATSVYTKPLPDLPIRAEPAVVNDLFTYAKLFMIHASLFRFNEGNGLEPYLVKTFAVSRDQRVYTFLLKNVKSHSGADISGAMVKASLERALSKRAVNTDSFLEIRGARSFIGSKSRHVDGIEITKNPLEFLITLNKPNPSFIEALTDIRFSIWNTAKNDFDDGFGPYQVKSSQEDQQVLTRHRQPALETANEEGLDEIHLVRRTREQALAEFKDRKVDDLFFYTVAPRDLGQRAQTSHTHKVFFPRTYMLVLNTRTMKNLEIRKKVISSINREELIGKCYPEQTAAVDLVPAGFAGHRSKPEDAQRNFGRETAKIKRVPAKISIAILESIGSEICVKDLLSHQLKDLGNVEIKVIALSTFPELWEKSKIDAFFGYIEGESTANYFGSFSPKAGFPMGMSTMSNLNRFLRSSMPKPMRTLGKKQPSG